MPEIYRYIDNTYLLGLVEFGIVGVLGLLIVYFAGMHCAAAGRHLTSDQRQQELGQAMIAAIMVGLVSGATFDALTFPMFSGLLFLILGCCGAYYGLMRAQSQGLTTSRLGTIWLSKPGQPEPGRGAAASPAPSSAQSSGNANSARGESTGGPY